jgi:hypothetical protein
MDENSPQYPTKEAGQQANNVNNNADMKNEGSTKTNTVPAENDISSSQTKETTRTLINASSAPTIKPGEPIDEKKLRRQMKEIQSFLPLKEQEAHFLLGQNGQTQTLNKIKERATVYIKACKDCVYSIDVTCARVLIEDCEGCTITLDAKITSNVVETWKCTDLNLHVNTLVSTLQLDLCKNLNIQFKRIEDFYSIVWAGIYGMNISFLNAMEHSVKTGFDEMKVIYPDVNDRTSQFITRWNQGKLQTEQLLRLTNGYPTTAAEKEIHEKNQQVKEEEMKKLIKVTIIFRRLAKFDLLLFSDK